MTDDIRYPIGQCQYDGELSESQQQQFIGDIADAPYKLRLAVRGLSPEQLDTPYRPEGWTVRQVVHHLPDSHLNAFIRFKLALTEDKPTIKPYHENLWAELPDSRTAPVEISLTLLESLHSRWVVLLRSMTPSDFARTFVHPERGVQTLDRTLALYAWHGNHHIAHITTLRKRNGWG
jgi:uncharacterized damage-inducible protein DinB